MTLLIKNVKIVGGDFPEKTDVFVSEDKISAIGSFPNKSADKVIDGQGAYLSPGFIDVNTDSDHYLSLFDSPEQEDFLRQGVTTIIGGMCGSSLAPLIYGNLESIRKWGDISRVNLNWGTMDEFLKLLEGKKLAVNFATLVGHSTIRRAIIGEAIRDLTKNELAVLGEVLRKALGDGGLGVSTGLGYVHSSKTPYAELKFVADIVKRCGGVYATHLRKMGAEIGESVDETIKLASETGVKIQISHFVPIKGFEVEYESALEKIENLPTETDLHFDVYPSDTTVSPLYTFLPDWAKTGGLEVMEKNLNANWMRSKILKEIVEVEPENFVLAQAPGNEILIGRSLKELKDIFNLESYKEALIKLMITTGLRGIAFYKNINQDLIKRAVFSQKSLIATNAASYPYSGKMLKPERAVSTFTKFIEMVVRGKTISLEQAVEKITIKPAKKFGLEKRGEIKEGNFADLTLFTINEKAEENARCVEIKMVVVNGEVVLESEMFTKHFPGDILRHKISV